MNDGQLDAARWGMFEKKSGGESAKMGIRERREEK